jgi:lipoprotein-anchoring transpeptidase ErfK/SrfK
MPSLAAAPAPPNSDRSIVVSLSQQALWVYEGGEVIDSTYVSTGTEKFATPTGLYYVNTKVDSQTMEGVLGGEYYNVPDVPYVMYFTDRGHAIHGAYWHDNFGSVMSHGCINLPLDIAAWMYNWAPMGMAVLIVD